MNTPTTPPQDTFARASAVLHALYLDAQTCEAEDFTSQVFAHLRKLLAVDAIWLGHSTLTEQGAQLHSSSLDQLPEHFLRDWAQVQHLDPLVTWAQAQPQTSTCIHIGDADLHPDFRAFLAEHGVAQVLCATNTDHALQTCLHVSLYRHGLKPTFDASDHQVLQAVIPHLASAVALNRMRDVEQAALGWHAPALGVALVSREGVIQMANPRFAPLMRLEWPDWLGGRLPGHLSLGIAPGQSKVHTGQRVQLELKTRADLLIATLRPVDFSSSLSARERMVAMRFAQGLTYKQVAKELQIAPATVRHHLRRVYSKLGIQDKGAIAWALHQASGPSSPPESPLEP